MKKYLLHIFSFLCLSFVLLFSSQRAFATHSMGADLTYRCVGVNTYEITLSFYRDCVGIAADDSAYVEATSSCWGNYYMYLLRVPGTGQEITPICPSALSTCRGGTFTGIQEYVFKRTVILPGTCTDWTFSYNLCCRNWAITNITTPGNWNIYIYATLNNTITPCNNSPTFSNKPVPFVCQGQQFCFNHGAYDVDGDSLVYSLITPLDAPGNPIVYNAGFSKTNPLTSNPAMTFNSATGDICMSPVNLEITVMAVLVQEFRNGVLIGTVERDIQITVIPCTNQLPELTGINGTNSFSETVCANAQTCFNIFSSDADAAQHTFISWDNAIAPASFVVTPGSRESGTFCWTPSTADISSIPYCFTVTVRDDNCPYYASQIYSYCITVQGITASVPNAIVGCNTTTPITATAAGGSGSYTYSWNTGATTQTINVGPGMYVVNVSDGLCTVAALSNVTQSPPVTSSVVSTNVSCKDGNNGTASVTPSGGTAPFTYSWLPSGGNGTTASNLAAGTYSVTVTDSYGCMSLSSVTITQPPAIIASTTGTNVSCNGGANGTATVVASGGTPGYTYSWSPAGGAGTTATNLSAGTYVVTVTDANGCIKTSTVNVTQPPVLSATSASTNVLCNGGANGSATATVNGGTAPYTYSWSPAGGTAATATNLSAGSYTATITDANGCIATTSSTVTQPTILTSSATSVNVLCNGAATGSATVTAGGGTTPYTYSWTSGGTGATANNLAAGNYSVTTTDGNGCTSIATVVITEPTLLTSSTAPTPVLCNGGNTGSASVTANGGTNPYTYSWTSGGTAATENNLSAGSYDVTTTDGNGCISIATVVITEPTLLTSSTTPTPVLCNGGNTGSATVTAGGGTNPYTYSWTSGGTASTENNLSAGSYDVTTTDGNGCTSVATVVITEPTLLTSSTAPTPVLCNGGNTGSATVTAGGGTNPYTYSWTSGGTTATENNLAAGSYNVTTTDGNGCTSIATVVITEPTLLTSSTAPTPVLCNGGNTGSASVTANGGTNPYTYSWTSGGTAATENNLSAGSYDVTTTDGNGCISIATVVITEPTLLTSSTSPTPVLCNGGNTGSATVTAGGGTNPYTYSWTSGGAAATENNLTAGSYDVTTTDGNGCTSIATVVITEPTLLTSSTAPTAVLCNGGNTGSATVTAGGGTNPYTYSWTSGGTAATENNLSAGSYDVTTTDGNGCISIATVVITEPTLLTSSTAPTAVLCNGGNTGSAIVTAGGGTTPYTYSWTSGGTAATENNLSAGSYDVTTTDGNGCISIATVVITEPTLLTSSTAPTAVLCNGGNTGSAIVTAGGGTNPYSYSWTSGGTSATENNLAAGSYDVTTTDGNGCTSVATVVITEPTLLTSSTSPTPVLCNGGNTGSASVIANGGTNPYSYSWTSGGTAATENNLSAGSYDVTTTDGNGCTSVATVVITEPTLLVVSASATPALCNGSSDGNVSSTVNGGTTPYTYSWSGGGGTGSTVTNLPAGNYTITITDGNGCITSATTIVTEPAPLTAIVNPTPALCNGGSTGSATVIVNGGIAGFTYSWFPSGGTTDTENNLLAGTYAVTIVDANGCTQTSSANVTEPAAMTTSTGSTPAICGSTNGTASVVVNGGAGGYSYSWSPSGGTSATASNVSAGAYTVTITDANGCQAIDVANVSNTGGPTVTATVQQNVLCNGGNDGSGNVNAVGGTAPYTYAWSPVGGSNATATNLLAGIYAVTVTDANGCISSDNITISEPPALIAQATPADVMCNGSADGSASTIVAGGTSPYNYSWSPVGGTSATAIGLTAGNYSVTITDANGCATSAAATVNEPTTITVNTSATSVTCVAGSTGTATAVVSGGTSGYTYSWSPAGGNAATATNLLVGSYSVTVTDANGCTATSAVAVSNVGAPTISASTGTNVSCNGGNNGTASVIVTSGTAPYTYSWSPSGGTGTNATNLSAGIYSVSVTDANGCVSSQSVTITQPVAINLAASSTPTLCGGSNGSASVTASGGNGAFTYSWSPSGGSSTTANNLIAGNYSVTVTDANGCTNSASVVVSNNGGATAVLQSSANIICNGGNNGTATVSVSGGATPYAYTWSPAGGSAASATGLSAGNYSVTVTDANGCISSVPVTITEPPALAATSSSVPASCGASNGSATINANGGTGTLTYSWLPSGGATATANNLSAGSYTVTVTDANGCSIAAAVAVSNIGGPTVTATPGAAILCNGGSDGTASVSVTSGTGPFTYQWTPAGGTSPSATNLSAGNYSVTVTDVNGCISAATVTITEPPSVLVSALSTPANCGNANGSVTANASGGTGAFTYSWSPNGGTGITAANLSSGAYTVTVTDVNGCVSSANVNVANLPGAIAAMQSSADVSCNGGNNGTATVSATGGTIPYSYSWSPIGGTNATATNLTAGNYSVTVTDANGCGSNASVTIAEPPVIIATTSSLPASCGSANGSASVSASGGTGALTYSWSVGGTTSTATNLTAGNYTVTITDANGCSITTAAAVSNIGGPTALASVGNNVSCNGGNNGSASVNVSSGTAPFTYLWTPAGGTSTTASNLSAGNYSVLVTDANGCITSESVVITEPTPVAAATSATPATCGASNGSASVVASGGTGGYTYLWSSGGSTSTETNLVTGNYTVTITDANGCATIASANVNTTGGGTASLQSLANVHCNGGNDGTATIGMTGGTAPFTYSWSPTGGTSATGTGLAAGSYAVTVTDVNGCIATLPVTINQPLPILTLMSSTQAACSGAPDGTASAVATGGTVPYTYLWIPGGGNGSTITSLYAGNYSVLVTDNNGCTGTNAVQVSSPSNVSLSTTSTPVNCFGGNEGTAEVSVTGGTAPFSYNWTPGGQSTATISNLQAGNYSVNVTDANGCISVIAVTVTQPTPLTLSATGDATLCIGQQATITATVEGGTSPYTYAWSNGGSSATQNVSPSANTVYTVDVTDANGCTIAPANVAVNVFPPLNVSATSTNEICEGDSANISSVAGGGNGGPYTYSWNNGAITTADATVHPVVYTSYTVVVDDGCSPPVQTTVNVNVNPIPVVNFTPHDIQGCTPVDVNFVDHSTNASGSSYLWNLGDGSTSTETNPSHQYTTPGDYNVSLTIVSAAGCQDALTINQLIHVEALPTAAFNMNTDELSELNSTVVFTDKSSNSYSWYWNFGDGKGTSTEVNPAYTYPEAGEYTVMLVTQNQLGCMDTAYSTLRVKGAFTLFAPNAFTPNADGINDGFIPYGIGWGTFRMVILDRWGLEIYHTTDANRPWDGTYEHNGTRCQSDVYVYKVLVSEAESGKLHDLIGHVTLVQ